MGKQISIKKEVFEELESIARTKGISVSEYVELLVEREIREQNTVYLLDYGEKGFIIRMPEDLPRRDPEHKKAKVVRIKMPEDAEYPEPKAKH